MAIEPLIVKQEGVYPQKIVRPQGPFVLYIENRLPGHSTHFSISLSQANATELVGYDTSASSPRTANILNLLPGTYNLHFRLKGPTQNAMSQNTKNAPSGWSVVIQITN
jgi:hypothetical protein